MYRQSLQTSGRSGAQQQQHQQDMHNLRQPKPQIVLSLLICDSPKGGGDAASITGVIIQPVDEEDPFEMTGKRLSAIRFDRNNRLMSELFAPNYLPDTRSLVPQQRINQLRKQGESLAAHQNKLNDELKRLEENFNNRKRTMENSSEEFAVNLKKACEDKPQLGEDKYNELTRSREERTPVLYSLTCEKTPSPAQQPMDVGESASRPAEEPSSSAATSNDAMEDMETTTNGQKTGEKSKLTEQPTRMKMALINSFLPNIISHDSRQPKISSIPCFIIF
uniref:Uncharacterized protein n=1 Tax=Ditylenchus dipsaci TaxID=166011 RepID=A0A915EM50_9BILA